MGGARVVTYQLKFDLLSKENLFNDLIVKSIPIRYESSIEVNLYY